MTGRKGRSDRHVTDAERELWEKVAQSVEPLPDRRPVSARSARSAASDAPDRDTRARRATGAAGSGPSPEMKSRTDPGRSTPIEFDTRKARKVSAGKIEFEATLDLHGMRQADAKAALRLFLAKAQAQGRRHVRVITGKGRETRDDRPFELFGEERGVLRRLVPHWLGEPELAPYVVGYGPAARKHGGEGALIIHVRRTTKPR